MQILESRLGRLNYLSKKFCKAGMESKVQVNCAERLQPVQLVLSCIDIRSKNGCRDALILAYTQTILLNLLNVHAILIQTRQAEEGEQTTSKVGKDDIAGCYSEKMLILIALVKVVSHSVEMCYQLHAM